MWVRQIEVGSGLSADAVWNTANDHCRWRVQRYFRLCVPNEPNWMDIIPYWLQLCKHCLCRGFCESYDMREHSTKVVRDIVSGLAAFIQSQFITQSSTSQSSGNWFIHVTVNWNELRLAVLTQVHQEKWSLTQSVCVCVWCRTYVWVIVWNVQLSPFWLKQDFVTACRHNLLWVVLFLRSLNHCQ